jgi:LPS sulfotransferase NodH
MTYRKMVFIGGLHRSGTTHLAQLLGQHPDASVMAGTGVVMDEGQYLQDVYPQDWQAGGPGCFAYDAIAHQTERDCAGQTSTLRDRLMQRWEPYWDMSRPVLIEKTPGNLLNARFLQSLFGEEAYFVFVIRHPLAVSLATRKWSHTSLFALMDHWLTAHDTMRQDLPHLRRVICVSYEQLVADPTGTLAEIHTFLGMRPMGTPSVATWDCNAGYFDAWTAQYASGAGDRRQARTSGAVSTPSLAQRLVWRLRGAARRHLLLNQGLDVIFTRQEARAILARHEQPTQAFGYSLVDLNRYPASLTVNPLALLAPVLVAAGD